MYANGNIILNFIVQSTDAPILLEGNGNITTAPKKKPVAVTIWTGNNVVVLKGYIDMKKIINTVTNSAVLD